MIIYIASTRPLLSLKCLEQDAQCVTKSVGALLVPTGQRNACITSWYITLTYGHGRNVAFNFLRDMRSIATFAHLWSREKLFSGARLSDLTLKSKPSSSVSVLMVVVQLRSSMNFQAEGGVVCRIQRADKTEAAPLSLIDGAWTRGERAPISLTPETLGKRITNSQSRLQRSSPDDLIRLALSFAVGKALKNALESAH